jgi:hypothetical protein
MEHNAIDTVRIEETQKGHVPVTPGTTDLPAFQEKHDVERAASQLAEARVRVDEVIRAIREKTSRDRPKSVLRDALREVPALLAPRRHALLLLFLVVAGALLTTRVASGSSSRHYSTPG